MLFLFVPALVEAPPSQAPLDLDLSGALFRARAENPSLRAAKAKVAERQGLITSTRADALPQLSLAGDYTRLRDVSILNSNMGDSIAQMGLKLDQLVAPVQTYTAQANLSQPVFAWGKLGTAIQVAKMGEREAAYAFTTTELDVLHGAANAYVAVLSAQAELEVVAARKKTAERFLEDVKAKLEAQTATELDRLRAESEYWSVVPEMLQAEANVKRAMELLASQLGLDPKTALKLADLGRPGLSQAPAEAERSELAQLKEQERMYRANDRILKAELRPRVDFNASYGYQARETTNLFKEPYDTWRVNLTMHFPIFDSFRTSGKRAQNNAQLEQVRQARIDRERAIAVEKRTAERELQKAIAYDDAARRAYDAALEALRTSRESFDQGLITSYELLQTERTERQQESQRRRAELGLWTALFAQRRAHGLPPL